MKLKTLKDIDGTYEQGAITLILQNYVQKSKIKKEVIKWVKNFGNEYNNVSKDILEYEFGRFFNITEEDLK